MDPNRQTIKNTTRILKILIGKIWKSLAFFWSRKNGVDNFKIPVTQNKTTSKAESAIR